MTESYKTPLTFNVIREANEVKEVRTVGRTDVVLLAFANDNFYLNVERELNKESDFEDRVIEFQRWQDSKSIDFNGWWQILVQDDPTKAIFRNYNSGRYLAIAEEVEYGHPPMKLVGDEEKATVFQFTSINTIEKDIVNFSDFNIFKISIQNSENPQIKDYIWIESSQDSDTLFEDDMNYYKKRV
jgi:hypothetical protein